MRAPTAKLRAVLSSSLDFRELVQRAGVTARQAALARAGKPISAGAYLALCGAAGIDPVDGSTRSVNTLPANVTWWLLSSALHTTRNLRQLDQRRAGKVMGMSSATVCRVERGKPVSIESMIKVCAFIGVHPDRYTALPDGGSANVPRGTGTETRCSDLDIGRGTLA